MKEFNDRTIMVILLLLTGLGWGSMIAAFLILIN